jgi:thioredoxin-like negative regulator of GroEL
MRPKPVERRPAEKPADPQPERGDPLFMGRQAFAAQEYGRAARFFKQASDDHPDNAAAYFLLAQAQFALGKYRDAVASIHAGLRLDKEWPASRFKPVALYGVNAGDHAEHRAQLQDALKRQPNDAVLLFLSAYQLWFDGQEDEARRLFGQARKLVTEPRFIDLFLIGPPAGPVVAR